MSPYQIIETRSIDGETRQRPICDRNTGEEVEYSTRAEADAALDAYRAYAEQHCYLGRTAEVVDTDPAADLIADLIDSSADLPEVVELAAQYTERHTADGERGNLTGNAAWLAAIEDGDTMGGLIATDAQRERVLAYLRECEGSQA